MSLDDVNITEIKMMNEKHTENTKIVIADMFF